MNERKTVSDSEKDSFWDLSELIPKKSQAVHRAEPIRSVHVEPKQEDLSDTVIKRYIPPHSDNRLTYQNEFESSFTYEPTDSLIHKVTIKKRKCTYSYYSEFRQDAIRYRDRRGAPCEYVPFFSYVPQYSQMNRAQKDYYFWFRESFAAGMDIRIDYSYVLLYVFELINLAKEANAEQSRERLTLLWERYHEKFPALAGKLGEWICDLSLLYRLPPPEHGCAELVKSVPSLKEFYIAMPHRDPERCVRSLMKYCTSYDYRASKFAQGDNRSLFDTHIFRALLTAVRQYSSDGMLLSGIRLEDSTMVRDLYAGALCTAEQRYRMEVAYCSFSRSNELRFLVGDIIKYSENKLRAYLGIKSKMTVYSISSEMRGILDGYFERALPARHVERKVAERQAYEALYDVPKRALSLSRAAQIEADSWGTTRELVDAFADETEENQLPCPESKGSEGSVSSEKSGEDDLKKCLGDRFAIVCRLLAGENHAMAVAAAETGKMPDALADEINEIAYEVIGDALIEDTDGGYAVIEEYRELIEELRKGGTENGAQ